MDYREFVRRAITVIFIVALVVLALLGIGQLINFVVLLFTGWVIAVTLEVPVRLLQRLKMPRIAAVLISILLLVLIGVLFIALVLPPFITQAESIINSLPGAIERGVENYDNLRSGSQMAAQILPAFTPADLEALLRGDAAIFSTVDATSIQQIDLANLANSALPVLGQIGNFVGSAIANLFLIALLALLLLLEPVVYYRALISLLPKKHEPRALEILNMVRQNVTTWLGAMLLSMAVTTILFLIVLGAILNLPNAMALSLLAGVATFVPTFGPTIALIPVAVVAGATGLNKLILTIILYAAVGLVQDRVITPAIMKSELDIPAAALVIFQLALAAAIGPLGLLLAVPILAIAVTLIRELFVFDMLHKRGDVAEIVTGPDGRLLIAPLAVEEVEEGEEAAQAEDDLPDLPPAAEPS